MELNGLEATYSEVRYNDWNCSTLQRRQNKRDKNPTFRFNLSFYNKQFISSTDWKQTPDICFKAKYDTEWKRNLSWEMLAFGANIEQTYVLTGSMHCPLWT